MLQPFMPGTDVIPCRKTFNAKGQVGREGCGGWAGGCGAPGVGHQLVVRDGRAVTSSPARSFHRLFMVSVLADPASGIWGDLGPQSEMLCCEDVIFQVLPFFQMKHGSPEAFPASWDTTVHVTALHKLPRGDAPLLLTSPVACRLWICPSQHQQQQVTAAQVQRRQQQQAANREQGAVVWCASAHHASSVVAVVGFERSCVEVCLLEALLWCVALQCDCMGMCILDRWCRSFFTGYMAEYVVGPQVRNSAWV